MTGSLAGRRVWVTGASSGIGKAVAIEFARRGCRVAISARNRDALLKLADGFSAGVMSVVALDVTDREANHAATRGIQRDIGGLDIAFLNAGVCEYVDTTKFEAAMFERVMRPNFFGIANGIEAALPLLRASPHPHLIGMSSTVAYAPLPRAAAYGASKAAIRYMLESLAFDLEREGIAVSTVCPGFVETPLTASNDFAMPALIQTDVAARIIVDGVAARRREIHFPRRFSLPMKVAAMLPGPAYRALIRRITGLS
ncbi:MAG: SDR family NAD(P)-dependent oxidoreductase [Candidatus Binataceae bacterium]